MVKIFQPKKEKPKRLAPPEFKTPEERSKYIIDHADYFTVIRRRNRRNIRVECKTLEDALSVAKQAVKADPEARLLIYAVYGVLDTYVTTVAHNRPPVRRSKLG